MKVLIIGGGLAGATAARAITTARPEAEIVVVEQTDDVGGMCRTIEIPELDYPIHENGAHIFHTDNEDVYKFADTFFRFEPYRHQVFSKLGTGEVVSLPFNMLTFMHVLNCRTPREAKERIAKESSVYERANGVDLTTPSNAEEQAVSLVGTTIYEMLIKPYTEKQWGVPCASLDASIMKRLPVRFTYDTSYFEDRFQAMPKDGDYTSAIWRMLQHKNISIRFGERVDKSALKQYAKEYDLIYVSASLDAVCDYERGELPYRSIKLFSKVREVEPDESFTGCAVMNLPDDKYYTRVIEHKNFEKRSRSKLSVLSFERPVQYDSENEDMKPAYPIRDEFSTEQYESYVSMLGKMGTNIHPIGRLGLYRYMDMDTTIKMTLETIKNTIQ